MIVSILIIAFFIFAFVASVMITGAEIAIGSISRDSVGKLMENKVRGAALIYGIIKNKRRFHLMLISGRIISIACGTVLLYSLIIREFEQRIFMNTFGWVLVFVVAISVFIIAEVVFARLIALGEYDETVSRFAYFLAVFHVLLLPLTYILDRILSIFVKKSMEIAAKEEALKEMVKSESEAGIIEQEEKNMIQGVLEFFDTTVREVMIPRIDMVAVEREISVDELLSLFKKEGHSRIPVYEGRIDNIIGVIYAKDILPVISEKGKKSLSITDIMRKPYYVPEKKKISDLLAEFKKAKVHIAIVVDEYGGTAGIVALEDLLEEIVGEIQDEYDSDERDYLWINDRTVLMDAGLDIDNVNEIIHSDIPSEEFDTLGGFIYHQLGVIPEGGEEFNWGDITFIIKEINGNRISKVLLKREETLIKKREEDKE